MNKFVTSVICFESNFFDVSDVLLKFLFGAIILQEFCGKIEFLAVFVLYLKVLLLARNFRKS